MDQLSQSQLGELREELDRQFARLERSMKVTEEAKSLCVRGIPA